MQYAGNNELKQMLTICMKQGKKHLMELTIAQVQPPGIVGHKEGKFQEAERLYRAILQS